MERRATLGRNVRGTSWNGNSSIAPRGNVRRHGDSFLGETLGYSYTRVVPVELGEGNTGPYSSPSRLCYTLDWSHVAGRWPYLTPPIRLSVCDKTRRISDSRLFPARPFVTFTRRPDGSSRPVSCDFRRYRDKTYKRNIVTRLCLRVPAMWRSCRQNVPKHIFYVGHTLRRKISVPHV